MITDLLLPAAVLAATAFGLRALGVAFAGSIAVGVTLAVLLWQRGAGASTWAALGLRAPPHWWSVPVVAVALVVGANLAVLVVARPLWQLLHLTPPDYTTYGALRGNGARLALLLAIAWSSAAFGEELLFRGHFLPRLQAAFGDGALAACLAVALQAVFFGAMHAPQGAAGVVQTGVVGLVFGAGYMLGGRTIWPLVLAHGAIDTLSLVALYAGVGR